METNFTRSSEAVDPGSEVEVNDTWTQVVSATDTDVAVKFVLQNNSDTDMLLRLDDDPDDTGVGFIIAAGGGGWEEDRYAGAIYMKHSVAGVTKLITRLIY